MGVSFLHELGQYFLDVKIKDIKHAIAGLLVEILLPVSAVSVDKFVHQSVFTFSKYAPKRIFHH
jgi:hypothetical protein